MKLIQLTTSRDNHSRDLSAARVEITTLKKTIAALRESNLTTNASMPKINPRVIESKEKSTLDSNNTIEPNDPDIKQLEEARMQLHKEASWEQTKNISRAAHGVFIR